MVRSVFMLLVLRAFCKWFVSWSVVSFIVAATDLPYRVYQKAFLGFSLYNCFLLDLKGILVIT